MKKRFWTPLLAAALAAGLICPALAAAPDDRSTTVTTTVAARYTVEIPQTIEIQYGVEDTAFSIAVTDAILDPKGAITVTTTAAGQMTNAGDSNATLAYTMQDAQGQDLQSVRFTGNGTTSCKVHIDKAEWNKAVAGQYSGTTTFTVSYTTA